MQNTENFNLKVYDGEDLFNPLTVENVNMNAIDTQMKKNENHAVGDATELVSGTVHAITRLTPDAPMLRFTATSRFTAGDTFTVDGVQVSALTVSGEQLPDGAYIIGSEVLAYLKGTLLTVFTSQGTLATAKNALKLGGNDPEYYATASAVQTAQETATSAGNLANEVNNSLVTWEEFTITPISSTSVKYSRGFYNDALKLVRIEFQVSNTNGWTAQSTVGTIPEKYRPKASRYIGGSVYTNNQVYCAFKIEENGTITQRMTSGSYTNAMCFGIYNI